MISPRLNSFAILYGHKENRQTDRQTTFELIIKFHSYVRYHLAMLCDNSHI
jgi:hypothetical protein